MVLLSWLVRERELERIHPKMYDCLDYSITGSNITRGKTSFPVFSPYIAPGFPLSVTLSSVTTLS